MTWSIVAYDKATGAFGAAVATKAFASGSFVPFVRVPDVDTAIALAKKYEHGFKHTSIIHSRNLETITRMGRAMDTTLFVQNGPSTAGLGSGGEGYLSFSIATLGTPQALRSCGW